MLRLGDEATEAARRLRPFCTDWPEKRFRALVYEAALVRLRGELPPVDVARMRCADQAQRAAYVVRLGERAG